jgi:hypothetical protein
MEGATTAVVDDGLTEALRASASKVEARTENLFMDSNIAGKLR